jgi:hypothetical protein
MEVDGRRAGCFPLRRDRHLEGSLPDLPVRRHREALSAVEFDKRLYIGVSLIADAAFARNIYELLKRHLDESIASIGDLDVAYLL